MKYMMLILLMASNVAHGMNEGSGNARVRTRPRSYTDELWSDDEPQAAKPHGRARSFTEELMRDDVETPVTQQNLPAHEVKAHNAQTQERAEEASDGKKATDSSHFSLKELQEHEAFMKRFKSACSKGNVGKHLDLYITNQCNKNGGGVSNNDIDDATDMFLTAYGDITFAPIKESQLHIQEDLNKCRGGKAGQFAYNFYNPAWQRAIQERHRQKLSVEQLLAAALERCDKNTENAQIKLVLVLIKEHFSRNAHGQGRLLLREAENAYRYGIYKFLYMVHMNPRRVFVALAAAAVIIYGSYRYYHRDY